MVQLGDLVAVNVDATDPVRLDASEPCCAPTRLGVGVMSASFEERSLLYTYRRY